MSTQQERSMFHKGSQLVYLEYIEKASVLPLAIWRVFFQDAHICFRGAPLIPQMVTLRSGLGKLKKIQIGGFTYLEQNPHSGSKHAQMAKEGRKILWVIEAATGKYIGKVIDGIVEKL